MCVVIGSVSRIICNFIIICQFKTVSGCLFCLFIYLINFTTNLTCLNPLFLCVKGLSQLNTSTRIERKARTYGDQLVHTWTTTQNIFFASNNRLFVRYFLLHQFWFNAPSLIYCVLNLLCKYCLLHGACVWLTILVQRMNTGEFCVLPNAYLDNQL